MLAGGETKVREDELAVEQQGQEGEVLEVDDDEAGGDEEDTEPPDTPTPMTRAQKRQAYTPLSAAALAPLRTAPALPTLHPLTTTQDQAHPQRHSPISTNSPSSPIPALQRKALPNAKRASVSGASHTTFLSTASKNSIFSTPGRDELEKKKALVELDEGPFARVQSMGDLNQERRKISSGRKEEREEKEEKAGALCRCVVM